MTTNGIYLTPLVAGDMKLTDTPAYYDKIKIDLIRKHLQDLCERYHKDSLIMINDLDTLSDIIKKEVEEE